MQTRYAVLSLQKSNISLLTLQTILKIILNIPDDRIPFQLERSGRHQRADGNDEGDVEDCRPNDTADTNFTLMLSVYYHAS